MRATLITMLIAVVFVACNGGRPSGVLEAKKMQAVLSDLYVAEAYSTMVNDSLHTQRNRNMDSLAVYYKSILAHHNISNKELTESIDWYKRNPAELDTIYAQVIPEVSKMQAMYPVK